MRQNSLLWLFLPIVTVVPITFYAASLYFEKKIKAPSVYSTEVLAAGATPELINQRNETLSIPDLDNEIVVVNFFFTHCPLICPEMTSNLTKVQNAFKGENINFISVSIDPENDSVARLKWYADKFGIDQSNWQLVTGNKQEIYKMIRNDFKLVAADNNAGSYDFIHSDKLVLLDSQRRIRGYYKGIGKEGTNQLITDIKKLKNEN